MYSCINAYNSCDDRTIVMIVRSKQL